MLSLTKLEELENLTVMMVERFMDVPDTAVFGMSAYSELLKELHSYRHLSQPGFHTVQVYTSCGNIKILPSNLVAPDHVSVGTIETETMKLLQTVDRLVFNYSPYFTSF
jgi:hypothetical protein